MRITPKTAAQIEAERLIPKGTYPCCIRYAADDRSQYGSDMLVITVELMSHDGEILGRLTDRITEKIAAGEKLRTFCDAFGLIDLYNAGELKAQDCLTRSARCEVIIKKSQKYGTRNEIASYSAGPAMAMSSDSTATGSVR